MMNRKTRATLAARFWMILLLAGAFPSLSAQSLADNPDYRRARELQQMSEKALQAGDYDRSYQYAEEARLHAARAEAYAARLVLAYKANGWRQYARDKVEAARAQGAERLFPDGFARAAEEYLLAESSYNAEAYEESIGHSRTAVAALEGFRPAAAQPALPEPASEPPTPPAAAREEPPQPVYPKYYRVRLIPKDRDCLHKIAAYPFVYNDRFQWPALYKANREKLRFPDNPDLIHPDQLLHIPSLKGEKREGIYDPAREYPVFPGPGR